MMRFELRPAAVPPTVPDAAMPLPSATFGMLWAKFLLFYSFWMSDNLVRRAPACVGEVSVDGGQEDAAEGRHRAKKKSAPRDAGFRRRDAVHLRSARAHFDTALHRAESMNALTSKAWRRQSVQCDGSIARQRETKDVRAQPMGHEDRAT